jgi:hypothetical protein
LNQGEFKLIIFFLYTMPGIGSKRKRVCRRMPITGEKKLRLETAVSESRPDVQDDIQAIREQEDEIWINPGMKAHPVAHWDGLDDEEDNIE